MSHAGALSLHIDGLLPFLPENAISSLSGPVRAIGAEIARREGPGADFLGWLDLPRAVPGPELHRLEDAAGRARADCDVVVVIGIGGSYLGAQAVLSALADRTSGPEIVFAGTHLCSAGLGRLLRRIGDRDLRLCVISKSGTTLEPAISFRLFRNLLEERYGRDNARRRITAVTDSARGALRAMADAEGYDTYAIPDDVGGRFSVLTPVGLWPLAVAGLDLRALLEGAGDMAAVCENDALDANPAHLYAAARHALYGRGFTTEVLSTFHSDLGHIQEWWKQLFGESEGKQGKGIFPASCRFTTDLHSLGQYLQDGRRDLFETFLVVDAGQPWLAVPADPDADGADRDRDGLAYLVGRRLDEINRKAYEGTRAAHRAGGVPVISLEMRKLDEWSLGGLLFCFEKAVAVSGRLLGVNPFDQPGVEAYKREMFKLLGKP
ncbi:glucose-6-phosphate isomerase [bacterium]|nr:glucose-6-phosphate isomerase [bacterium]